MTRIDVLVGEPHFADHTAPIWHALPEDRRGDFLIRRSGNAPVEVLRARAQARGIPDVVVAPNHHGRGDGSRPVLVASYSDMEAARQSGRKLIARLEHGIGQSFVNVRHPSYAGGSRAECVGLFLCPNEHSAGRWRRTYPAARVEVVGSPHIDDLPQREPTDDPTPVVALSFHWGTTSFHAALPEVLGSFSEYAPTLPALARSFTILGHGHPRQLDRMTRVYARAGIEVVPDFADVCRRADLYVCDTNSTIYEFASTGRPVVVVNGKHFRKGVKHGLRFDWGTVTNVGVQCNAPGELSSAIAKALWDRPAQRKAREAALDQVFQPRTGGAERAALALVDWADGLAVRAA